MLVFDILNFQTLHCMPSSYFIWKMVQSAEKRKNHIICVFNYICPVISPDNREFAVFNLIEYCTHIQDISKLLLQTSRGCRGDLVDKVLIRYPCPETYHFDVK